MQTVFRRLKQDLKGGKPLLPINDFPTRQGADRIENLLKNDRA